MESPRSSLFLCVDAGGTKTRAAIANAKGEIIGTGGAGPGNMASAGVGKSCLQIQVATWNALQRAGLVSAEQDTTAGGPCLIQFQQAWIGISGCDTPRDISSLHPPLNAFLLHLRTPLHISNDAMLLSAPMIANGSTWGMAVVAGTGSVVVALGVEGGVPGVVGRKGGNGHLLGDYGSAFHLGRTAVEMLADKINLGGKENGTLARAICAEYGVKNGDEVVNKIYDMDNTLDPLTSHNNRKNRLASISRFVIDNIPTDPLALQVATVCAEKLAQEIVETYLAVKARLSGSGEPSKGSLCMTGGVIGRQEFRELVIAGLETRGLVFGHNVVIADAAEVGAKALALAAGTS